MSQILNAYPAEIRWQHEVRRPDTRQRRKRERSGVESDDRYILKMISEALLPVMFIFFSLSREV